MHNFARSNSAPVKRPARGRRPGLLLAVAVLLLCTLPLHADDRHVQRRVPPVYPELARRMHIGGMVRVSATVAPDGSVTNARATDGNKLLTTAAEDAVRKWKFAPADGATTEVIDVNFEVGN
ncbi:energy transducer TonB [Paracidobacterium acidisoli]|uniref:Energy transducer TonB n=1 Tax=Paracidobacterium acidisoli TaxID=2303751 RepID=A0A372IKJ3_9BACT|nr:energy transducer TonB [Paracidobacterium acidisoli]MBT9332869.1 energy transducer TonB [Paracidobacterium acidisoli]